MDSIKLTNESLKIINRIKDIFYSILLKSIIIFHSNVKGKSPYIIYDKILYGDKYNDEISYEKLMEYKEYYLKNEKEKSNKNFIKFFEFLDEVEERIKNEFKYNYCLLIKMEFNKENNEKVIENKENKEKVIENNNDKLYIINSLFTLYHPINKKFKYRIENILSDGTCSIYDGFEYMINDINSERFENIEYKGIDLEKIMNIIEEINLEKKELIINNSEENDLEKKELNNSNEKNKKKDDTLDDSTKSNSKIKGVKIIENYNESEEYEKELNNGILIESNTSNNDKYKIYYVKDIILIGANNGTRLNNLNLNYFGFSKNLNKPNDNDFFVKNIILMKKGTLIFCSENGIIIYNNSYLTNKPELTIINDNLSYIGGIRINENLVVLTSNKILSKGEDKLVIYNINTKKKIIDIENYSFALSQNNLSLINIPESFEKYYENKKLIICACKQYLSSQKNGILLAVLDLDNNEIYSKFYQTTTFEVYCFCQIISNNNNNNDNNNIISENNKDKVKNNYTEYILVGGFAPYNSKLNKLYKINFNENIEKCEMEFIRNIIIQKKGDFKGFKGAIKSITQSRENGNILVTCDDKNAYLFPQEELFEIKNNNIY